MRTLFLNPPSFEGFDAGAGSRWPATREVESYWYPVSFAIPRSTGAHGEPWLSSHHAGTRPLFWLPFAAVTA